MDGKSLASLWGRSNGGGEMKHGSFPLSLAPLLFLFFFFFLEGCVGDYNIIEYNMITEQSNFRKQ